MKKILIVFSLLAVVFALSACQEQAKEQEAKEPVAKTDNGTLTLDQIGNIQPGFGVIMMEIGERFTVGYYAAKAEKWDLASYELDELKEAAEIGMTTRPKRKDAMEKFLDGDFKKLEDATKDKDFAKFQTAWDEAVKGCNACHDASDKEFIKYELPETAPEIPSLK